MSSDELRHILDQAKENLRVTGSLTPVLIVDGTPRTVVCIGDVPETSDARRLLFLLLGQRLADLKPRRVVAVMDAYMKMSELGLDLPLQRSLADDPGAQDCIVVSSLDRQGRAQLLMCPYTRQPSLEGVEVDFWPAIEHKGDVEAYVLEAFFDGVREGEQTEGGPGAAEPS